MSNIYLAGMESYRMDMYWDVMRIYLDRTMTDVRLGENPLKVHVADNNGYRKNWLKKDLVEGMELFARVYSLESFYYAHEWQYEAIPYYKGFMLDSGAFTYMSDVNKEANWADYVKRYIAVIKKYKVRNFFELDIDAVVGLKKVEEIRDKIEQAVGRQSIPVWHKARGLEYFQHMIEEYKYVSIGGIVSREIMPKDYPALKKLVTMAHEKGCKIHGLGFTKANIKEYRFDSVDSTAWVHGNIGGYLYHFTGTEMKKVKPGEKQRLKGGKAAMHNFMQWVLYAEYLESF